MVVINNVVGVDCDGCVRLGGVRLGGDGDQSDVAQGSNDSTLALSQICLKSSARGWTLVSQSLSSVFSSLQSCFSAVGLVVVHCCTIFLCCLDAEI